jgi:hypothetical protein
MDLQKNSNPPLRKCAQTTNRKRRGRGLLPRRKERIMRDRIEARSTARRWPAKIFSHEQIKEERRNGRSFLVALQDGYRASDRAILDASALIVGEVRA